jgi:hypothetical protein
MGYLFEVILLSCLVAICWAIIEEEKKDSDRRKQLRNVERQALFQKLAELRMKGGKR